MPPNALSERYLAKAERSLAGAISEFANERFENCANRCYYACFQAAIGALIEAGIQPKRGGDWGHDFVQAQFNGELLARRKRYSSDLRGLLNDRMRLGQIADYEPDFVSRSQASRGLRAATSFLSAIRAGGERA